MDLLRFLLLLPIRAIGFVGCLLGRVLRPIVGNVSWTASRSTSRHSPRSSAGTMPFGMKPPFVQRFEMPAAMISHMLPTSAVSQ